MSCSKDSYHLAEATLPAAEKTQFRMEQRAWGYNHLPHLPRLWTENGNSGAYSLGDRSRGSEAQGFVQLFGISIRIKTLMTFLFGLEKIFEKVSGQCRHLRIISGWNWQLTGRPNRHLNEGPDATLHGGTCGNQLGKLWPSRDGWYSLEPAGLGWPQRMGPSVLKDNHSGQLWEERFSHQLHLCVSVSETESNTVGQCPWMLVLRLCHETWICLGNRCCRPEAEGSRILLLIHLSTWAKALPFTQWETWCLAGQSYHVDGNSRVIWFLLLFGERKICIHSNVAHTSVIGIIFALIFPQLTMSASLLFAYHFSFSWITLFLLRVIFKKETFY